VTTRQPLTVEGLVLSNRELGEADRLAMILTGPQGKLVCRVRGARKPKSKLRASTEPAMYIRCQVAEGRSMHTLTQVEVLDAFSGLRRDWRKSFLALLVLEVVEALCLKGQPNELIFELVLRELKRLETTQQPVQLVQSLLMALLSEWGAEPSLRYCPVCGEAVVGESYFSPRAGGLACKTCAQAKGARHFRSPEFTSYFQGLLERQESVEVSGEVLLEAHKALHRWLQHYLDKELPGFLVVERSQVLVG
jgi:DNA repair protein RecO (recombination protein O)